MIENDEGVSTLNHIKPARATVEGLWVYQIERNYV